MKGALAIAGLAVLGLALFVFLRGDEPRGAQTLAPGRAAIAPTPSGAAGGAQTAPLSPSRRPETAAAEPAAPATGAARTAVAPPRAERPRPDARARLTGFLMSASGPVEGGRVVYQSTGRPPLETQSDRRGTFEIVFDLEQEPGMLCVRARGFALFELGVGKLRPGENRALGNLNLAEGVTLVGRVVDGGGRGVPDATVGAASTHTTVRDHRPLLAATTASDGRFRLEDVPRGNVRLDVSARGLGSRSVEALSPSADLVIELAPGASLEVRLRDQAGPVAGAAVRLEPLEEGSPSEVETSDATGLALFQGLGSSRWTVVVSSEAYRPLSLEHRVEEGRLELELVPWPCVAGRVVAPDGGPPPAGTRVWASHRTQAGGRAAPQGEGSVPGPDGGYRLCPVYPGAYEVIAEAPGFARTRSPELRVPLEGDLQAGTLVLERGGRLIVVADLDGAPPADARVELYSSEPHAGAIWNAAEESPFLLAAEELGADGTLRLEGLETGTVWLVLRAPDFLPLLAGPLGIASERELLAPVLRPERGGRIGGRVTVGGDPVSDATVLIRGGTMPSVVRCTTDARGGFLTPALPEGTYRLWTRVTRSGAKPLGTELDVGVSVSKTTSIEVPL